MLARSLARLSSHWRTIFQYEVGVLQIEKRSNQKGAQSGVAMNVNDAVDSSGEKSKPFSALNDVNLQM